MCLTTFAFVNCTNSSDTNCGPLSLTICCGMPFRLKISRSSIMVSCAVVELMIFTSGNFECAPRPPKTFGLGMVQRSQYVSSARVLMAKPMVVMVLILGCADSGYILHMTLHTVQSESLSLATRHNSWPLLSFSLLPDALHAIPLELHRIALEEL